VLISAMMVMETTVMMTPKHNIDSNVALSVVIENVTMLDTAITVCRYGYQLLRFSDAVYLTNQHYMHFA
jgi:hypothetical protein